MEPGLRGTGRAAQVRVSRGSGLAAARRAFQHTNLNQIRLIDHLNRVHLFGHGRSERVQADWPAGKQVHNGMKNFSV